MNTVDRPAARKGVTSPVLYAMFVLEYRKRQPAECRACRVPLPFLRDAPDNVSANWDIGTPAPCVHHCDAIMAEILAHLWTKYDLLPRDDDRA